MVNNNFPDWANQASVDMLNKNYLDDEEGGLIKQFNRMCKTAAMHAPKDGTDWEVEFFNMMWRGWYSNSTPCLANLGNRKKGMPVSCSSSYIPDSLSGIYIARHEIAMLTKNGFGCAAHLDDIRPRGELVNNTFPSTGVLPIIQGLVQDMNYVCQSSSRRGSIASYLNVEHGDFKEVCNYLKESPKDLNIGWNINESFIDRLKSGDEEAIEKYQMIMANRYTNGKGYFMFLDKSNKLLPESYKREGLTVKGNNLCSELLLPTDDKYTFNCTLGSLNIAKYDEWKDTNLIRTATVFLDCVNSEFLEMARGVKGLEKIVRFAERFRPIGLGQMGLHTYMQDNSIVFGSFEAMMLNTKIAKQINEQSLAASQYLAEQLGEPDGCKGLGIRAASRIAIAPTKSSSNIMGGVSQGIEPYFSTAFVEPLASGYVVRENPAFVRLLESKGMYSKELMQELAIKYSGSVQHLDFLNRHEKAVFKAVFEINQMDVLKMAASRQKHIDQMQSINLTFGPSTTPAEISAVHKEAILNPYILSLYYCRRITEDKQGTFAQVDLGDCLACE